MEKQFKNIGYFFLVLLIFVALGFYYPYFSLFPDFKSVTSMVHLHALVLMLWVAILIAQPLFIRYRKYRIHGIVGRLTYFIFPLVIFSSLGVIRQQYEEGLANKMSSLLSFESIFISLAGVFSISTFYLCAIANILKGNIGLHVRWVICLFLEFIPPTVGRTLGYWLNLGQFFTHSFSVALAAVILIILLLVDRSRKLDYTPYAVALTFYLTINCIWFALGHPI